MSLLKKITFVLGSLCAWECQAVDYFIDPRFSFNQRVDSNIRLVQKPQHENWVSTFSPGVDIGFRRENNDFKTNFTWNQLVYDNETALNIDEQLLDSIYRHNGEKIDWGMEVDYFNQSSLNSEVTSTGLTGVQVMRHQLNLAPNWAYSFDKRNTLAFNYSYSDTSYDKNPKVTYLYDYTNQQGSVTFTHLFDEKDKLNFTLLTSLFSLPGNTRTLSGLTLPTPTAPAAFRTSTINSSQSSVTETAQVGWQHSFSEQLIANLSGGIRFSQTDTHTRTNQKVVYLDSSGKIQSNQVISNSSNTNFGQVFNASLQNTLERGTLSFSASQQLSPTAQGNQQIIQFNTNNSYHLSERWSTGIDASYIISSFPTQSTNSTIATYKQRDYYSISPNVNWKWTPEVNVQLSYTYRQQNYSYTNGFNTDAFGNMVQFQINYQPQINRQVK